MYTAIVFTRHQSVEAAFEIHSSKKETTGATSVYKDVLLANHRDVRKGSGILLWPFTK